MRIPFLGLSLLIASCGAEPAPRTSEAADVIAGVRGRFHVTSPANDSPLPIFPHAEVFKRGSTRVTLPAEASGAFELTRESSDLSIRVKLEGARSSRAEEADGYLVYRNAHPLASSVIHRVSASGTEDFLVLDGPPALAEIRYRVELGAAVAGLRLVGNALDFEDARGVPQLRIAPPWILDAAGAVATVDLSVEGCAVDTTSVQPWLEPVTPPGARECTVVMSWDPKAVGYPALLDPSWSAPQDMNVRRYSAASTMHHGFLYVAGGINEAGQVLSSVEYFNGSYWTMSAPMKQARAAFTLNSVHNPTNPSPDAEKLLAIGGYGAAGPGSPLATAEVGFWWRDWLATPITFPWATFGHTATTLPVVGSPSDPAGVLVHGGYGTNYAPSPSHTCYRFNSDSFTPCVDQSAGTICPVLWSTSFAPDSRAGHTATLFDGNRKLLIAGGRGKWIFSSGSDGDVTSSLIYDVSNPGNGNSIKCLPQRPVTNPRNGQSAIAIDDQKVLLVGGGFGSGGTPQTIADLIDFAPSTAVVTPIANSPSRFGMVAGTLQNGAVLVAGGFSYATAFSNVTNVFDTKSNSWSGAWAGVPLSAARYNAIADTVGGRLLVGGGFSAGNPNTEKSYQFLSLNPAGAACTSWTECESGSCDGVCRSAFYVNNQAGSNCNDNGPGTSTAAPWCSLARVNAQLFVPGDRLLFARGATWFTPDAPNVPLELHGSGTAAAPIVVDAYGVGNRPIIRGHHNVNDRTIKLVDPSFWTFNNLELSDAGNGIFILFTTLGHEGLRFNNLSIHDIDLVFKQHPATADNIWGSAGITITRAANIVPNANQWILRDVEIKNVELARTDPPIFAAGTFCPLGGAPIPGTWQCTTGEDLTPYPANTFQKISIRDSYFHDARGGMSLQQVSDVLVMNNRFDGLSQTYACQGTTGIFLHYAKFVSFVNNMFWGVPPTFCSADPHCASGEDDPVCTAPFPDISPDQSMIDTEDHDHHISFYGNHFYDVAGPALEFLALGPTIEGPQPDYNIEHVVSNNTFVRTAYFQYGGAIYRTDGGNLPDPDLQERSGTARDNLFSDTPNLMNPTGDFAGWCQSNNRRVVAPTTHIHNAPTAFGGVQGPPWNYQSSSNNGATFANLTSYDSSRYQWGQPGSYISRFDILPDTCDSCWMARAWTAPSSGLIPIRGRLLKSDLSGGNGVLARITQNGSVLWPPGGLPQPVTNTSGGFDTVVDDVNVNGGDVIRFEVNNALGGNNTGDLTSWAPTIAYATAPFGSYSPTCWSTDSNLMGPDAFNYILKGDFNGDGKDDIAITRPGWNAWRMSLSNGHGFDSVDWFTPPDEMGFDGDNKVVTGNFDGDPGNKTDIAVTRPGWGGWHVYLSTGTGFNMTTWSTTPNSMGWDDFNYVVSGDFDGAANHATDIAITHPGWNSWHVYRSTGTGFTVQVWGTGAPSDELGWDANNYLFAGKFTNDNLIDIAVTRPGWNSWHLYRSTGSAFSRETWSNGTPDQMQNDPYNFAVSGDFDGNGLTDIAVTRPGWSGWKMNRSTGTNWFGELPVWSTLPNQLALDGNNYLLTGDFDGNGKTDIATTRPDWHTWVRYLSISGGNSFSQDQLSNGPQPPAGDPDGWQADGPNYVVSGNFNGDTKSDIAMTRPMWSAWRISLAP